jgi:N4-(beta-N-acetylglucosaminyl)-L-asparaginase
MERSAHTFLVGDLATEFAVMAVRRPRARRRAAAGLRAARVRGQGFEAEDLGTPASEAQHAGWVAAGCQPNFYRGFPGADEGCPPYAPPDGAAALPEAGGAGRPWVDRRNHDTIGVIAIQPNGDIAAGTSTNGARHKVPGRVGDSPVIGSGAYVDNDVGAAVATGDGDLMMRFSAPTGARRPARIAL